MASLREEITVVGVSGSLRPGSLTSYAVQVALKGAKEAGARVRFLDLRDYGLNLLNEGSEPEGLKLWREDISGADGMILGTPEYHGSFSGVLKNALDYLGFDQTEGKMIGLVGVSAGALGAFDAMNGLRSVGRALHAWVVPQQAAVPEAWKTFDGEGNVLDADIERRLLGVGSQVARFAHLHKRGQIKDFLADWEKAPVNPGGEAGV